MSEPCNESGKRFIQSLVDAENCRARYPSLRTFESQNHSGAKPSRMSKAAPAAGRQSRERSSRKAPQAEVKAVEIAPGYKFVRAKDHLSVFLEDKFFEKKPSVDEQPPVAACSSEKIVMNDIVTDLQEEITEMTDMMEQLHRDYKVSQNQMEKEMEEKCEEIRKEYESMISSLEEAHRSEIAELQESFQKLLELERAAADEKMEAQQKEYRLLKNAFQLYKSSIADEMEEKWLKREADWKKSEKMEWERALILQKQVLTNKFKKELQELTKLLQDKNSTMEKCFQQEKELFMKQNEENLEKIAELQKCKEQLEAILKEKEEKLEAVTTSLQEAESELQKQKTKNLLRERNIKQRIASVEEKHQITEASLHDENLKLRHKLVEKNEEVFGKRVQRRI